MKKINNIEIKTNNKKNLINNYRTYNNINIINKKEDIYTREMALMKKKELKLEEIRKKEIEEENNELTYKPKINKKSK